MRSISQMKLQVDIDEEGEDGFSGYLARASRERMRIVVSWGEGWEHVSVSWQQKCPVWGEMVRVKQLFWEPHETVVQYHPAASEYRNLHPYCLHLWRPTDAELPVPPAAFIALSRRSTFAYRSRIRILDHDTHETT